jgi:dihydropteroate synthase
VATVTSLTSASGDRGRGTATPPAATLVMGILNATPDSFCPKGRLTNPAAAVEHVQCLIADGADIVDVGGESSRPGAEPVPVEVEQARVFPIFDALRDTGVRLSIDTYHASTARGAIARGARMVNDITALRGDPVMAEVVAEAGCECVLMHMQGTPQTMQLTPRYNDVIDEIGAFFDERLADAVRRGIREDRVWLDPGFGFGKSVGHNLEILRRLGEFKRFGRPLLVGTSNKSTIGRILDLPVDERLEGTAATVAIAVANGADAVRVHDVRAMRRVVNMADAIMGKTIHG